MRGAIQCWILVLFRHHRCFYFALGQNIFNTLVAGINQKLFIWHQSLPNCSKAYYFTAFTTRMLLTCVQPPVPSPDWLMYFGYFYWTFQLWAVKARFALSHIQTAFWLSCKHDNSESSVWIRFDTWTFTMVTAQEISHRNVSTELTSVILRVWLCGCQICNINPFQSFLSKIITI